MGLLEAVEDVAEGCDERDKEVAEDLEEHAGAGDDHGDLDEAILLHDGGLLLVFAPIYVITRDATLPVLGVHESAVLHELEADDAHEAQGVVEYHILRLQG